MREITMKVYTLEELSDKAKEKARDWYRDIISEDTFDQDEIVGSLMALYKACGIRPRDWSIGAYNQSNGVTLDMGDAGELSGKRAFAWIENNLFGQFRIKTNKKDFLKYGDGYRVGQIKSGPLTGMCYDEDFFDRLRGHVKSGMNLHDSFTALADDAARMIEDADDYRREDAQVDESITANEYEFTIDGKLA